MNAINVAEGKARFSELVARAEAGEEVVVARRGKPVVKLVRIEPPRRPLDVKALWAEVQKMPMSDIDSVDVIRAERDSGY